MALVIDKFIAPDIRAAWQKCRIHIPGAVYHVILRGNEHRDIFVDDKDRYRLFSILVHAVQRFRFKIHALCIK